MKKLEKLLLIVLILLLFYLTKDINMLPLCISFSMYILFHSIFSTTNITKVLEDSHVKKYYYSRDKIFKYSIVFITLIGILLTVISYFIGNIININNLATINIFMSLSLLVNILLKIINEYLNIVGYKKISNNLININNIITLIISIILSILLYKVFKLDNYINIILLYSISIVVFIIITILLYILVFRKRRKYNKKKEENKINYISIIKNVVVGNQIETIFNVIKSAYIYTSIIILYYVLTNKYNYQYLFL